MSKNIQNAWIENVPGAIILYRQSHDQEILDINKEALSLLSCNTLEEFYEYSGGLFRNIVPDAEWENVLEDIQLQTITGNIYDHVCYHLMTKGEKALAVEERGRAIQSPDGYTLFAAYILPTEVDENLEARDIVTGLYTRRGYIRAVERMLFGQRRRQTNEYGAVIYFNIRKFKIYNLKYGFKAGNKCLNVVGEILRKIFCTEFVSRFSDDHFVVFTSQKDIEELIHQVHKKVFAMNHSIRLWVDAGIYLIEKDISISQACDFAKMACDSIVKDETRYMAVYTDAIAKDQELRKYIVDHIDEALQNHYIKIYYQPVIRTLTGKLCGMEALARWQDPKKGLLFPGQFIPILEDGNLIYKLDNYVIERVAVHLKSLKDAGETTVPVSINISRLDFGKFDPYQKVLEEVEKYQLLREWICVEVTESAIADDPDMIRFEISKFQNGGFEVLMDDFGSGYSSLNALKDYPVDEIKFDMVFLKHINERAKRIVMSAVSMAKKLNIHTLAEGVETKEHVEFLRQIGCEKMQGFFFSPPLPYDEMIEVMKLKGCEKETREERAFYEEVGKIDLVTDSSIALVFYDHKEFHIVYMNQYFWEKEDSDFEEIIQETGHILNGEDSFLRDSICSLANRAEKTQSIEEMDCAYDGRYYRLSFVCVAKSQTGSMLKVKLTDITFNENKEQLTRFNTFTRSILNFYDRVAILDYRDHTIETYLRGGMRRNHDRACFERNPAQNILKIENVLVDDRIDFLNFFDSENVQAALKCHGGKMCAYFFVKGENGNYERTEFSLCLISLNDSARVLLLQRTLATIDKESLIEEKMHGQVEDFQTSIEKDSVHWNDLMSNTDIYFFWKDKARRFLGASRSFLNYYGFDKIDEILGKTDEEIKWHIDDAYFRLDEEQILEKGISIHNAPGQNLIRGVIHNIFATKFPTYDNGQINGLMGYFIDAEKLLPTDSEIQQASFIDKVTGLMNTRGFMIGLIQFEDNFRIAGEEYWLIVLEVSAYADIMNSFGKRVAEDMIIKVSEVLKNHYPVGAAISRISRSCLTILEKSNEPGLIENRIQECIREIVNIRSVDGFKCTLYINHSIMQGSAYSSATHIMDLIYANDDNK